MRSIGRRESILVRSPDANRVEVWQVAHHITPDSPLWPIRNSLARDLHSVEVSFAAFDSAFMQEVRMYHTYAAADLIEGASFIPMTRMIDRRTAPTRIAAHSGIELRRPSFAQVRSRELSLPRRNLTRAPFELRTVRRGPSLV